MKKFNFGKIFALMAAGAAVFALVFAGCDQLNDTSRSALEQPKTAEVTGASGLKNAFADPGVKVIGIQGDIKADTLKLTVSAGDKTIYIPGGKETAIGSLELSPGSHVKLMNGSGGTAKSVSGALAAAYSEQTYDGWATFVIWDHFKIPEGATFDLAGEVRLVFRVAEVEGTLKAEIEDSILGAGEEAPVITGNGNVQTSKETEAKTPELAAAGIKNSGEHKILPLTITAAGTGIMSKGGTRQFTANRTAVTWTVEGGSKGGGSAISETGLLTVGDDEANITLTVKAVSGEDTTAKTVKVKGWKDITANLAKIIDGNINSMGQGKYMGIEAAAYGNGTWVVAGYSAANWYYGAVAWSKDEGETWTKVALPLVYNESINTIIYDGPEGGKQFIIGGNRNNTTGAVYRSTDGVNWTRVSNVMPAVVGNVRGPVNQLVYGEVEGGGIYIATNGTNVFAYSSDGITWTNSDGEGNNLYGIKRPDPPPCPELCRIRQRPR
ncbi:MAG: hypothetical protein LBJ86_07670 [Spirochaetaceae bacterium]|jgi:hypothetical protein|nr:hypothetical protein [Spirochaetaceae bacterium]